MSRTGVPPTTRGAANIAPGISVGVISRAVAPTAGDRFYREAQGRLLAPRT